MHDVHVSNKHRGSSPTAVGVFHVDTNKVETDAEEIPLLINPNPLSSAYSDTIHISQYKMPDRTFVDNKIVSKGTLQLKWL